MSEEPLIPPPKENLPKTLPHQKRDVTQAVKQEHGMGGRKKPSEIIQQYIMQQTGNPKAVAAYANAVADLINKKVARLIQFGNTVFLAQQKAPGWIDVHIFTEDSPKTLVGRMKQAYGWAKQNGFTKITSTLTDPKMAELVKAAGLPASLQQTTVNTGQKMEPAYLLTLEVK